MEPSSQMKKWMEEKEEIEKELKKIKEQFEPYVKKGFEEGLIDREGFPKPDLEWGDLVEYKNLKRRNAELTNDYKDLMKKIENELYNYHAQAKQSGQAEKELQQLKEKKEAKKKEEEEQKKQEEEKKKIEQEKINQQFKNKIFIPFAQITEVTEGSPAFKAGIQLEDLIFDFGGVNSKNHCHLSALVFKVKENIGGKILIKVLRVSKNQDKSENLIEWNNQKIYEIVELNLSPQKWEGQGVTGCRFKEI